MNLSAERIEDNQIFNTSENVVGYASLLHNKWRATRKEIDGVAKDGLPLREPRLKPSDPNEPESEEIDIANLPYEDLPPAWQEENLLAAKKAMNDVQELTNNGINDVVDIEEASARSHVGWKNRNTWAQGEQAGPYGDMSVGEKNKDREILLGAIDYLTAQGYKVRAVNKGYMFRENLEKELAENDMALEGEKDSSLIEDLNGRQRAVRALLANLEHGKFLDRGNTIDRYGREPDVGTEGAKQENVYANERGEDRYGYRDGESREDKEYRLRIEELITKGDEASMDKANELANKKIEEINKKLAEIGNKPTSISGHKSAKLLKKVRGYMQELADLSSQVN